MSKRKRTEAFDDDDDEDSSSSSSSSKPSTFSGKSKRQKHAVPAVKAMVEACQAFQLARSEYLRKLEDWFDWHFPRGYYLACTYGPRKVKGMFIRISGAVHKKAVVIPDSCVSDANVTFRREEVPLIDVELISNEPLALPILPNENTCIVNTSLPVLGYWRAQTGSLVWFNMVDKLRPRDVGVRMTGVLMDGYSGGCTETISLVQVRPGADIPPEFVGLWRVNRKNILAPVAFQDVFNAMIESKALAILSAPLHRLIGSYFDDDSQNIKDFVRNRGSNAMCLV